MQLSPKILLRVQVRMTRRRLGLLMVMTETDLRVLAQVQALVRDREGGAKLQAAHAILCRESPAWVQWVLKAQVAAIGILTGMPLRRADFLCWQTRMAHRARGLEELQ
jgi:hypothetical protein